MTVLAIGGIAFGTWLWVRQYRTPPDNPAARRRLLRELRRHNVDLYEHHN